MRIVNLALITVLIIGMNMAFADNVPPSQNPPGGLQPAQCPQFVVIGFDDNTKSEGINWVLDFLRNKRNPAGSGNSGTYDNAPARVSFYSNTIGLSTWHEDDPVKLKTATEKIISDGHELGNHTFDHHYKLNVSVNYDWDALVAALDNYTVPQWEKSIKEFEDTLTAFTTVSSSAVNGFRTPYLQYKNNSFKALKNLGVRYDCSIEEGAAAQFDGTNFRWPYTLDSGSPGHEEAYYSTVIGPLDPQPGLWELPNYMVMIPSDAECPAYGIPAGLRAKIKSSISWFVDRMTGFDYNLWDKVPGTGASLNKAEMLAVLKYNLDKRYSGNRAPFMFGAHSQYYIGSWADSNATGTSANMRAAIEEFITYALSKPDVRMVPANKIIDWCRAPVALNDTNIIDTTNPSENLITIAGWEADADAFGSTVDTGSAIINSGVMKVSFNQVAQPNDTTWPWVSVTAYTDQNGKFDNVKWIKLTYKCDKGVIVSLPQPPLSDEGSSYQIQIPASGTWKTELLKVADFKQPAWVTIPTPLNLSIIHDVMFEPVIDDVTGGTATLEINNLILYGYEGPVPVVNSSIRTVGNGLTIRKVTPRSVKVSVPENGQYSLSIFTVNGRQIAVYGNRYFTEGAHSIAWNGHAAGAQVYLITLQGANERVVRKAVVQ
jgi:hypothetical protein